VYFKPHTEHVPPARADFSRPVCRIKEGFAYSIILHMRRNSIRMDMRATK
jgi:hypothetical protein